MFVQLAQFESVASTVNTVTPDSAPLRTGEPVNQEPAQHELNFQFLHIVASHPHYVPLNLPLPYTYEPGGDPHDFINKMKYVRVVSQWHAAY